MEEPSTDAKPRSTSKQRVGKRGSSIPAGGAGDRGSPLAGNDDDDDDARLSFRISEVNLEG